MAATVLRSCIEQVRQKREGPTAEDDAARCGGSGVRRLPECKCGLLVRELRRNVCVQAWSDRRKFNEGWVQEDSSPGVNERKARALAPSSESANAR